MYNVYTLPYRSLRLNAIVSTLAQDAQKAAPRISHCMFEPSSSSRVADDTAEGESAREYEEAWGHPCTRRGTRSGRTAKRKRDAYIRHISEQQCVDPLDVPVIHQGVRAGHSATWGPASSEEDEPDRTEGLCLRQLQKLLVWSQDLRHIRSLRQCPRHLRRTAWNIGEHLQFVEGFLCQ